MIDTEEIDQVIGLRKAVFECFDALYKLGAGSLIRNYSSKEKGTIFNIYYEILKEAFLLEQETYKRELYNKKTLTQ